MNKYVLNVSCVLGTLLVRFWEYDDEWDRPGPSPQLDYSVRGRNTTNKGENRYDKCYKGVVLKSRDAHRTLETGMRALLSQQDASLAAGKGSRRFLLWTWWYLGICGLDFAQPNNYSSPKKKHHSQQDQAKMMERLEKSPSCESRGCRLRLWEKDQGFLHTQALPALLLVPWGESCHCVHLSFLLSCRPGGVLQPGLYGQCPLLMDQGVS